MEQRPLEYTVKIYCEGFTEWYYFEWLAHQQPFQVLYGAGHSKEQP